MFCDIVCLIKVSSIAKKCSLLFIPIISFSDAISVGLEVGIGIPNVINASVSAGYYFGQGQDDASVHRSAYGALTSSNSKTWYDLSDKAQANYLQGRPN